MANSLHEIEILGGTIKARIACGDRDLDKAEQHYKSAGLLLLKAKEMVSRRKDLTWNGFLLGKCSVQRSRADELIKIANGETTVAEVRAGNRERDARRRERQSSAVAHGKSSEKVQEKQSSRLVDGGRGEIERLKEQLAAANAEIDRLKEENESLRADSLQLDDEREIAEKLVEMDGKKLAKLTKILHDYLKYTPQTPAEVSIVLGYSFMEGDGGRSLGIKAALEKLRNPEPVQEYSWRVEAVAADETRWSNGVRLRTEEEAKTYADRFANFDIDGCISAEAVKCDGEPPTNSVIMKRGRPTLLFDHGTCGSLQWKPCPTAQAA